jgi:hypothetical protein
MSRRSVLKLLAAGALTLAPELASCAPGTVDGTPAEAPVPEEVRHRNQAEYEKLDAAARNAALTITGRLIDADVQVGTSQPGGNPDLISNANGQQGQNGALRSVAVRPGGVVTIAGKLGDSECSVQFALPEDSPLRDIPASRGITEEDLALLQETVGEPNSTTRAQLVRASGVSTGLTRVTFRDINPDDEGVPAFTSSAEQLRADGTATAKPEVFLDPLLDSFQSGLDAVTNGY